MLKIMWLHKRQEIEVPACKTINRETDVIENNFRDHTAWIKGLMGKEYLINLFGAQAKANYLEGLSKVFMAKMAQRIAEQVGQKVLKTEQEVVHVSSGIKEAAGTRKRKGPPGASSSSPGSKTTRVASPKSAGKTLSGTPKASPKSASVDSSPAR